MNLSTRLGPTKGFLGPAHQKGAATLFVAIITLLLLTIMTLYFSRVAVMDQRMSGNEARYKEAFSAAMFGLDTSAIALEDMFSAKVPMNAPIPLSFNYTSAKGPQSFDALLERLTAGGGTYYNVRSTGVSTDGTGSATVSRQYAKETPFNMGASPAPVVVGGVLNVGGGFEVVANPEGYCVATWNNNPDNKDDLITDEDYCAHPDEEKDPCYSALTKQNNPPISMLAKDGIGAVSSAFGSCYPPGDPDGTTPGEIRGLYPADPDPEIAGCDKTQGTGPDGKNLTLAPSGTFESANQNFDQRPGYDIWDNVADFPDDLFVATFGRSPDVLKASLPSSHIIKASECGQGIDADHPYAHLDGDEGWYPSDPIIESSNGIWWVEPDGGKCDLKGLIGARDANANGIIEHDPNNDMNFDDSELHPAIIIADETDLEIVANTRVYGVIFFLDRNKDEANIFKLAGGATVHGSILANYNMPFDPKGDNVVAYDKRVVCSLQNVKSSPGNNILSPIQGSWHDS